MLLPLCCAITSSRAERPLCVALRFSGRARLTIMMFLYSPGLLLCSTLVYMLSCVSSECASPCIRKRSFEPTLMPQFDADYYYYGTAGGRTFWVRLHL